jgi:hypothetical protein
MTRPSHDIALMSDGLSAYLPWISDQRLRRRRCFAKFSTASTIADATSGFAGGRPCSSQHEGFVRSSSGTVTPSASKSRS